MVANKQFTPWATAAVALLAFNPALAAAQQLDINLDQIQHSWGQVSTYADNPDNFFGVQDVGLPDGCQVEQAHLFQRHAQRFPTGAPIDGKNNERFAAKVANYTKAHPNAKFTGPLAFLSTYQYIMGEDFLTGYGADTEFLSGVNFWNRYGRTIYNSTKGQLSWSPTAANGTTFKKPVLRTTNQSRIENSQINWALGFFGPSFEAKPDPQLTNLTKFFDVVIIPEGGTENNTLASYDGCPNANVPGIGYIGDDDAEYYAFKYLPGPVKRLSKYVPAGFGLNATDVLAMQAICAYEYQYIGMSDFCTLFTQDEWAEFNRALTIDYYYSYSWGNPTGRAQGIGYVQELVARLTHQYITVGNTSVNTTFDNNGKTFPVDQPIYADFSHDSIIISILTALDIDYFKDAPSLTQVPPNNSRFNLARLTPFGGRLVTEVIGCNCADPVAVHDHRTAYTPTQHGYDPNNAGYKFIRMRINNGIVPIASQRTGACKGRTDGMCSMQNFLKSQQNAEKLANYQYVCFANYTLNNDQHRGKDYDGTIHA